MTLAELFHKYSLKCPDLLFEVLDLFGSGLSLLLRLLYSFVQTINLTHILLLLSCCLLFVLVQALDLVVFLIHFIGYLCKLRLQPLNGYLVELLLCLLIVHSVLQFSDLLLQGFVYLGEFLKPPLILIHQVHLFALI